METLLRLVVIFMLNHLNGTEGGDNYVMAGRYIDKLIRSGDEWRINKDN